MPDAPEPPDPAPPSPLQTAPVPPAVKPAALSRLFDKYAVGATGRITVQGLEKMMKELRRVYQEDRTSETTGNSPVPAFDAEFFELVMYALDDDEDKQIDREEWTRWILRGASMDKAKREKWANKDKDNLRLDLFLRSVIFSVGSSLDSDPNRQKSFDSW